jgi:hypothetical protein
MTVESFTPIIPSADLERSLRLWVEGLGFNVDSELRTEGKLSSACFVGATCTSCTTSELAHRLNQRTMKVSGFTGHRRIFMA